MIWTGMLFIVSGDSCDIWFICVLLFDGDD